MTWWEQMGDYMLGGPWPWPPCQFDLFGDDEA
jgi:hypothetical protein